MTPASYPADTSTPSCYARAEPRLNRWLEKYQRDRAAHEKARRSHADPATLDADFARVVKAMGLSTCHLRPDDLQIATAMLHDGARATVEHFQNHELSENLGKIVDVLEAHSSWSSGNPEIRVSPELAAFVEALTSSASVAVLTNKRYVCNGGMVLPLFVLRSVTVGDPWYSPWKFDHLGSSQDRAFRRVCLRLLARMAFLSAERSLASEATHPFMVLLEMCRGREGNRVEMRPVLAVPGSFLVQPTSQAAFLQVIFLMIFVHRRFPWHPRRQYLADVRYREELSRDGSGDDIGLANRMVRIVLEVPGVLHALVVDNDTWHIFVTYSAGTRSNDPRQMGKRLFGESCLSGCFRSRIEEDRLVALLRDTRLVSKWLCGENGRHILLDVCRQRRRRVLQVMIA